MKKILLILTALTVSAAAFAEKITTVAEITSGNKYYVGATTGDKDYYFYVDGSAKTESIKGVAKEDVADAVALTFTAVTSGWTIQFDNGLYLGLKDAKDNGKVQVMDGPVVWTIEEDKGLLKLHPNASSVPIIEILNSRSPLMAEVQGESLELTPNEMERITEEFLEEYELEGIQDIYSTEEQYFQYVQRLLEVKGNVRVSHQLDFTQQLNPFIQNRNGLFINQAGNMMSLTELGQGVLNDHTVTSVYYRAGYLNYLYKDGQLSLRKVGEENGVPTYREIEKVGATVGELRSDAESITWYLDPIDTIEIEDKGKQLASSPLGIYQYDPVVYKDEKTGESIQLESTITPGSFVSSPAEGLTNIQSAQLIKGDQPIDAIRIKVAGITEYTNGAAEKIKKVAKEIESIKNSRKR